MSKGNRGKFVRGDVLRNARHRLGWTQEYAAQQCGFSDRLIRKLEGGGPVHAATLQRVVQAYRRGSSSKLDLTSSSVLVDSNLEHIVLEWFDRIYHQRDLAVIEQFAADRVEATIGGQQIVGCKNLSNRYAQELASSDEIEMTIERVFYHQNDVIAYWTRRQRCHQKQRNIAMPELWQKISGVTLATFLNGKIVELREHSDLLQPDD